MKIKYLFLFLLIIIFSRTISSQNWQDITSIEDVCSAYPERITTMFGEYNLNYPGLEKVKKAFGNGNLENACTQLLEYYKNSNNALHLRKGQPENTKNTKALANSFKKCTIFLLLYYNCL